MRINWKTVKNLAEMVGGAVSYVLLVATYRKIMEDMLYNPNSVSAHYDDAVKAIMDSGMYSHDKADAIAALKRNGNTEFYKAIIHIADDESMFSHDKVSMVKALSEN